MERGGPELRCALSFYLFRFLSLRTGQIYLFHQTVLEPRYERHMATFFLKERPQTDSFGTRDRRGLGARAVAVEAREGGETCVCVARWRASERG